MLSCLMLWCQLIVVVLGLTEFPSPQTEWRMCGRQKPSFVCDPDFILDRGEVEKLDKLAHEFIRSTTCLCPRCPKDEGIAIGIFIKHNFTQGYGVQYKSARALAEILRKRWKLATCDDDIVIVLLTQHNTSDYSMGPALQQIFSEDTANKIIKDCRFHFESGYYYQGLESVVNSFNDVLMRLQKKDKTNYKGLITGIVLGFAVLLILATAVIALLYKQAQRRKRLCTDIYENTAAKNNRSNFSHGKQEQLEKLQPSTSDDEEEDDDANDFETSYSLKNVRENTPPSVQFIKIKRQLSDVPEESSEDNDKRNSGQSYFSTSQSPPQVNNHSIQVTEL